MLAIGSSLYVWGGCAATCVDVSVYALDTTAMMWSRRNLTTGAPPTPREGHVTALVHGRMVVFGGCDGKRGRCYGEVHVYDPIRDRWTQPSALGRTLPVPTQGAAHVVVGSEVLAYGGCSVKGAPSAAAIPSSHAPVGGRPWGTGSNLCTDVAWSLTLHFTSLDAPAQCPRNCSGNGLCHRGICACAPGFAGYGCESVATCHSNCSSHGICVHGQCFCDLGYGGAD